MSRVCTEQPCNFLLENVLIASQYLQLVNLYWCFYANLQVVWLNDLYSIIHYNLTAASSKSVEVGRHTLRICCGVVRQGQAPLCVRIGPMMQGQYASWCTRKGYWFISLLWQGQYARAVLRIRH